MFRLAPALLALGLLSCQQLNPDVGRFSCATTADCGDGYECRPQFQGGGRCFKLGQCVDAETCDGADENCDGRTDESFPEQGQTCSTGLQGVCATGTRVCTVGALACMQTTQPSAELCNRLDDDCDGQVDEAFDLTADEANCGQCGRACATGTTCLGARCEETRCDDGSDDDQDGRTDCDDLSCLGFDCATTPPPAWRCGAAPAPDAGLLDGGADAGFDAGVRTDAGLVLGCYAPEGDCANGLDDDGDGNADCMDLDCDARTCASGTLCTNLVCPGPG